MDAGAAVRDLYPALSGNVLTDMTVEQMVGLATAAREGYTAETIEFETLEGTSALAYDEGYGQQLWMVLVDPAEVEAKAAWLTGGR